MKLNNTRIANLTDHDIEKIQYLCSIIASEHVNSLIYIDIEKFFKEYKSYAEYNLSVKTNETIITSFKHLQKYFSPKRQLTSLTLLEIDKFIRELQKRAPKGYRCYYRTLKAAFNKAIDWGYIKENPFLKIKLPKQQILKPAYLTSDDFQLILAKIEIPVVYEISTICFYSGMRLSEATFLRWRNIDLKKRIIIVGDSEFNTKTRRQRAVPIHDVVEKIFIERSKKGKTDKDDFVFAKRKNKPYTTDFISKRFKKACRAAGADEKIHFHSLRHSAASNLVQKNVPLYTVQKILGHTSINTTQIYAHLDDDSLHQAVNKL